LKKTGPVEGKCRAMIRVYDVAGNVVETHEQAGDFKEWLNFFFIAPGVCSLVTFRRG
jgi:hypothetical protein